MSALDKIASHQDQYSCKVDTLGECKIVSPVHHHEFIREGERIFVSEEEAYMKEMEKKLNPVQLVLVMMFVLLVVIVKIHNVHTMHVY